MYDYQTSDLIFEKVLDSDRTLTKDPIVAFLEQNGNFYYQTPLMSLARTYHKTDDYGHTELIKQFTDVLQNYSIDESDDILTTLDTQKDNPRLLIILKNKIDGFTDKSPATTMGRLYSQMASNIVLADTLISRQERLSKRQFTNTKLKDFRNILLPNIQKSELNGSVYPDTTNESAFLPTPLISRSLIPFWSPDPTDFGAGGNYLLSLLPTDRPNADVLPYYKFVLNGYYFIDYEKLLNYKSQISKIFNPYIIEQIFGKGSLSNFFYYSSHSLEIEYDNIKFLYLITYEQGKPINCLRGYSGGNSTDSFNISPIFENGIEGTYYEVPDGGGGVNKYIRFTRADEESIYCQFVPRYLNTLQSIGDYRISCFELTHIEYPTVAGGTDGVNYELFEGKKTFTWRTNTHDKTMVFYDLYIREKIMSLNNTLKKYLNFASDFCSYNNIDNKFNDFFIETIRNNFEEPYPWLEAPLYYYLFSQMIELSLDDNLIRKRDGKMLDFESIKNAAKNISKSISPDTGNLKSLEQFSIILDNFVRNYFIKKGLLDEKFNIYEDNEAVLGDGYKIRLPHYVRNTSRQDELDYSDYITKIIEDSDS